MFQNRRLNPESLAFPIAVIPRRIDAGQKGECGKPQGLDLDGITFTGRSGRRIGIHPCKMGRAENKTRFRVHPDTVGGTGSVGMGNGKKNLAYGSVAACRIEKFFTLFSPYKLVTCNKIPQRCIGSIPVSGIFRRESYWESFRPFHIARTVLGLPGPHRFSPQQSSLEQRSGHPVPSRGTMDIRQ